MPDAKKIWLANNSRILIALLIGSVLLTSGIGVAFLFDSLFARVAFFALGSLGLVFLILNIVDLFTPRLAREKGHLIVHLKRFRAIRLPLEIVEVFFLGQGDSKLEVQGKAIENSTIVVRLAESAIDWHRREVNPKLGHWCEGYITIRGAWCEPINVAVIRRLNQELAQAKKDLQNGIKH